MASNIDFNNVCYDYQIQFANEEEAQHYIKRNGFHKVFERERKKGGHKLYYDCDYFNRPDVRCPHKLTLTVADGIIVGKTTDMGRPHNHRICYGRMPPASTVMGPDFFHPRSETSAISSSMIGKKLAPTSATSTCAAETCAAFSRTVSKPELSSNMSKSADPSAATIATISKPESSSRMSTRTDVQLQNLLQGCSSGVLNKMKYIYERKRRDKERIALQLFSRLPLDRQREFLEMQEKLRERDSRPQRRLVDFVRAQVGCNFPDELLQQTHLSALGIGDDDNEDAFGYDSPLEEEMEEENDEDMRSPYNWDVSCGAQKNATLRNESAVEPILRTAMNRNLNTSGVEMARDDHQTTECSTMVDNSADATRTQQLAFLNTTFGEMETQLAADESRQVASDKVTWNAILKIDDQMPTSKEELKTVDAEEQLIDRTLKNVSVRDQQEEPDDTMKVTETSDKIVPVTSKSLFTRSLNWQQHNEGI
ncbi:hypothetical protein Tcan_05473 [Toxocara canis]|uniref:Uncharacterized protein n=1 Tax=Toxocara canis TaxID=6265 RepID=A0A0B2UWG1_TOXCA|nr:hypothetical protein Tcan_05473 [Toxocara canis]